MTSKQYVQRIDPAAVCRYIKRRGEENHIYIVAYLDWNGIWRETPAAKAAHTAWADAAQRLRRQD